jgi:anionic cell wall polymer biosynthesis LytR-Cps2A-Psr (LCP) family protein
MFHKRKGLSRVLIEIALIVIALAAVGLVYQIFSSSSSGMSSNLRASVDGYLTNAQLVLNIDNIGSVQITGVSVSISPGTLSTSSQSITINPGEQKTVTFGVSSGVSPGTTCKVYVIISSGSSQSVEYVLTMTAQ